MALLQEWDSLKALIRVLESHHLVPGSIAKACYETRSCIAQNKDNLRGFFEQCFPVLLKRTFGYDDFEASWLNLVTKPGREADATALKDLLSPRGPLFQAMETADKDQRIQFIFPIERLPAHTQELLKTPVGRKALERWPQYAGRIIEIASKHRVHLNVFEYFIFWTAFYVLRGSRGSDAPRVADNMFARGYMQSIKRMGLPGRGGDMAWGPTQGHLYYEVLREYLSALLPPPGKAPPSASPLQTNGSGTPYGFPAYGLARTASTAPYPSSPQADPGDIVLNVLLEFWLTDNAQPLPGDNPLLDPAPSSSSPGATALASSASPAAAVAGAGAGGGGVAAAGSALRSVSYQPPSEELVEGLTCLMRHLNVLDASGKNPMPAQGGPEWLPPVLVVASPPPQGRLQVPLVTSVLSSPAAAPPYQLVSRLLYRFLRRAFSLWPPGSSTPLTPIVHLWLAQIAPWVPPSYARPLARSSPQGPNPPSTPSTPSSAGSLDRMHSLTGRLHLTRPEATPPPRLDGFTREWKAHALAVVPFTALLLPHFLELTYVRLSYKADAALSDLLLLLRPLAACPGLLQELRNVEASLNRYLNTQPRRAEGPYADLLPWLAEQAADWEHAAVAGVPSTPPLQVDATYKLFSTDPSGAAFAARAIVEAARRMQGVSAELVDAVEAAVRAVLPVDQLPGASCEPAPAPEAMQTSHFPRAGSWKGVAYRGSWLRRPVASYEVGALVRPLVRLSEAINASLELDRPWRGAAEEPAENILQEVAGYARRKGWQVDLRFLADKALLGWLLALLLAFWAGRRVFSSLPDPVMPALPVAAPLPVAAEAVGGVVGEMAGGVEGVVGDVAGGLL